MTSKRYSKRRQHGDAKSGAEEEKSKISVEESKVHQLIGFDTSDLCAWESFVKLLHRPTDPSALALLRIIFGLLMVLDIPQERGMANADYRWGDPEECRFPLFNFLQPLSLPWMFVVYLLMLGGAVGIMLGLLYRLSCLTFVVLYWYILLLDKTVWNNHSYLYGLCGLMFLCMDAHRYWSIDGLIWPKIQNTHVPLWNYTLFRTQIFLVYFIAGLKKFDADWVSGYSMQQLSSHWVFAPFSLFLTADQVDLWMVHRGGLLIDLFAGYFLFFDATRWFGALFTTFFHVMNSQIFTIGMFPYMMMGSTTIFYYCNWPKNLLKQLPHGASLFISSVVSPGINESCVYSKAVVKPESTTPGIPGHSAKTSSGQPKSWTSFRHHTTTFGVVTYIMLQCFLPYSHFLTPGYNNWTSGLYGYSWDMMVHSWSTQHVRLTYTNRATGQTGYLNPEAFTRGNNRWNSHADMVKQYVHCVKDRLQEYNMTDLEIRIDVWRSLNDRFQQRLFDSQVDILTAEWSPFRPTKWVFPLLADLSDWREKMDKIEKKIYAQSNETDVVFIADFPGFTLENYIQPELGNTSIQILKGEVVFELVEDEKAKVTGETIQMKEGDSLQIPAGEFHNVHTVSKTPACYMYIFTNTTEQELTKNITDYEQRKKTGGTDVNDEQIAKVYDDVQEKRDQLEKTANRTMLEKFSHFLEKKYKHFCRGFMLAGVAVLSLWEGESFESVFNRTIGETLPHNELAFVGE